MRTLIQDLRHGVRLLRRAPGFAALAVSALAIGIGANTTVFSVVNAVLLKRPPYEDPHRLAIVWERNIPRNRVTNPVSPGNFLHWREMNHSFTDLAAVSLPFNFTLTGAGDPVEVPGQLVSGQFFSVLGVRPMLGRLLTTEDDRPGNHVAVMSDRLWSRRFNRDSGVLEHPVSFAGEPYTIVGILPAEFSKGRLFNDDDPADSQGRIVVNATLARQHWPDEDPIGKRISVSWGDRKEDDVIGVVGDMRHAGLDAAARATTYWPYARNVYGSMSLAVRTGGDGHALANTMIELVRREDPQLAVTDVRTMDEVVSVSVAQKRLLMLLVSIFAAAALILVAVGIYGVIAYSVTERTQEIGIRMALGAQRSAVLRMIVGQALLLAIAGVVLGSISASLLTRLLTGFLFQVDPADPLTFAAVAGLVMTVALAASSLPGLRATRVDPVVALRRE